MGCGSIIGMFTFFFVFLPLLGITIFGIILVIVSIVIFIKKKNDKQATKISYVTPIVIFLVGLAFILPIGITVIGGMYNNYKVENLKNVIWADERYWKKGFEYNDKQLVKFDKLHYGYKSWLVKYKNVANIRFEGTHKYKPVYKIENEIPFDLFFVKDGDENLIYVYDEDKEKFWNYYLDNVKTQTKVRKNNKEYDIDFSFRKFDDISNHSNIEFIELKGMDVNEEDVFRIMVHTPDYLFEEWMDVVYNDEDGKYYMLYGGYESDWHNSGYVLCDSCNNYIEQCLNIIK